MPNTQSLVAEVRAACRSHALLLPDDRVLVAVSGGADSTALAALLGAVRAEGLRLTLHLAHVDHGWRSEAAARADRVVVEALADRLGAPLHLVPPPRVSVPTEEAARRLRYRELGRLARANDCSRLATGHHLRDQAETVLMRLLRGSGPVGLRGIPWKRPLGEGGVTVVRPLLGLDPRRLRAWLRAEGIAWAEDETNLDLTRDRVRARRRLLAVEERGGTASRDLAALAERLTRRLAWEEARLRRAIEVDWVHHPMAEAIEVPRRVLAELAPADLDLALRLLGNEISAERDGPWFTRRHLRRILPLLAAGGAIDLPRGLCFEVTKRRIILRRRLAPGEGPPLPALVRRDVDALVFGELATFRELPKGEAVVDADRLGQEIRLRRVRADDRFVPYGRAHRRSVRVVAWLAKRQVPRWLRERLLVVEGENGIAWVCDHRVDREHAVTPQTRRVAILRLT